MATNPMLQAVLLFQNHQTTTPYMPIPLSQLTRAIPLTDTQEQQTAAGMAKPKEEKEPKEGEEEEENGGENGENGEEEQEGERPSA